MGAIAIIFTHSKEETVPTEPAKSDFQVMPPIILNEDADVVVYASVEALIRDVELVDVLNKEFEYHDSTGRVLEARVYKKKVSLVPTSRVEADSPVLRSYMLQVLRLAGVQVEALSSVPFGDLARILLETSGKKK